MILGSSLFSCPVIKKYLNTNRITQMSQTDFLVKIDRPRAGRHLFQVLSQVKDSIQKNRFNLAWEIASKHYEQNRNSLSSEEIYRLCQHCCLAIQKKITHRMTAKHKRYVAPVTSAHIQHVLSLELSLHKILLPELVRQDRQYFNMLNMEAEGADPRSVSAEDLVFQRKISDTFLTSELTPREMKKIVKQHLQICNAVVMYSITKKPKREDVISIISHFQALFMKFKEHQFPSEIMNFELIKLSVMEELGLKQGIQCEYRLPLGFLGKIYRCIKKKRQEKLDFYLRKLTSYFVLSFRHLNLTIADIFVACSEAQEVSQLAAESMMPSTKTPSKINFTDKIQVKRQVTLESTIEESHHRCSNFSKKTDSFKTLSKFTDKKMGSKKKGIQSQTKLREVTKAALKLIDRHLEGRKQLNRIILKYFCLTDLKKLGSNANLDDFIDKKVAIDDTLKGHGNARDSMNGDKGYDHPGQNLLRKKSKSMTLLNTRKGRAKTHHMHIEGQQPLKLQTKQKEKGAHIIKNIQKVRKVSHTNTVYKQNISHLLSKLNQEKDDQPLLDESSSDEEGNAKYDFQMDRRRRIQEFKIKQAEKRKKDGRSKDLGRGANSASKKHRNVGLQNQEREICQFTLDGVRERALHELKLPHLDLQGKNMADQFQQKLIELRTSVNTLNTERSLMVQELSLRKKQTERFISLNSGEFFSDVNRKGKEEVDSMAHALRTKIDSHIRKGKNLLRLNSDRKGKLPEIGVHKNGKREKEERQKQVELTVEQIQGEFRKMGERLEEEDQQEGPSLYHQFDRLRRDVAKNQFASLNQKKNKTRGNKKCQTILQCTNQLTDIDACLEK